MSEVEKLQAIYDMEKHISVSWFWDGGVDARITESHKGSVVDVMRNFNTVAEAVDWLYERAKEKNGVRL